MTSVLWIVGIAAVFFLFVLLYALCRVSADADEQAGYMEEYSSDLDEGFDEEEFEPMSLS